MRKLALFLGFTLSGAKSLLVNLLKLRITRVSRFFRDYSKFKRENKKSFKFILEPHLIDNTEKTKISKYYFYQDIWGFGIIQRIKPAHMVDIGSSHTLVGMLSQVTKVTSLDIRPIDVHLPNLDAVYGDIKQLPFDDDSIELINSLCVMEHIGLGRYGDEVDSIGFETACNELDRVLKIKGHLVLSIPIGEPIVVFNAHRVFSRNEFLGYFPNYKIVDEIYCIPEYSKSIDLSKLINGKHHVYCVCLEKHSCA